MNRIHDDELAPDMAERRELLMGLLALSAAAGAAGTASAADIAPAGTVRPPDQGLYKGRIDGFRNKTLAQKIQEL